MVKYFKELPDVEFFAFSEGLNGAITTNGAAWNVPALKVTELDAKFNIYKPFIMAIINKKTRTSQQVEDHRQQRVIWQDYVEGFANTYIINNASVTDSQVGVLGFNRRSNTPAPRPQITAGIFAKMEAQEGSKMLFVGRTNTDSSRASLAKDADAVELRYTVGTAPATVNDCKGKEISTKARFTLELDPADAGKKIYGYLRWRNNSDPRKSGPWCDVLSTVIRS